METTQTIKLNMFLAVRNFKRQNEEEAAKIHKFNEAFDTLMKTVDELLVVSEMQGKKRTGLTIDKNLLRKDLIEQCVKNSNKLSILSLQNENYTLLRETQFRESQLRNMSDLKLVEKAQLIYNNVQANLDTLAEQGITPESQKFFNDSIISFNSFLSMPRTAIADRKKATMKINELFITAEKYIKIMDLAAQSVKKDYPDFYNNYKAARVLVDTGARNLALKASARELPSGIPLGGVVFIFRNTGAGGELKKKTTAKGNFQIRNIKPGPWKVFVSKKGYRNSEIDITIEENVTNQLKVEMEKA